MIYRLKTCAALLFLSVALLAPSGPDAHADSSQPLTVVELFTSQGCSSCPPADAYLGDLAAQGEEAGVLALSFHVDYWDNLGWKDPYSNADNTRRQRAYAGYMDLRYVYTPQMVVHGVSQATGSDRRAIARQIKAASKLPALAVDLQRSGKVTRVALSKNSRPVNANIFMVVYDKQHVTKIKRGENSGKTITNRNVVRAITKIASWNGEAASMDLSPGDNGDACAVIVQSAETGAILGAATIALN